MPSRRLRAIIQVVASNVAELDDFLAENRGNYTRELKLVSSLTCAPFSSVQPRVRFVAVFF